MLLGNFVLFFGELSCSVRLLLLLIMFYCV